MPAKHGPGGGDKSKKKKKKKKKKKLSEKGKKKLISHKALLRLNERKAQGGYEPGHGDKIQQMLEEQEILKQIEDDIEREMDEKEGKNLDKKHHCMMNQIVNAQRRGVGMTVDIVAEAAQKKEAKKEKRAQEKKIEDMVHAHKADMIVESGLELALIGKVALHEYLCRPEVQAHFDELHPRVLIASIDTIFSGRRARMAIRVEMLWRFAVGCIDCLMGPRKRNLDMAVHCLGLLKGICDPDEHPFEYAALQNSLLIARDMLDRIDCDERLAAVNKCSKWDKPMPPNQPRTAGFVLRRDLKEAAAKAKEKPLSESE